MVKTKQRHLGGLPPTYSFIVNPYPEERVSRCPLCNCKTGQRKLPILIHVNPKHLIALNYTCRYCRDCNLLIAHKHQIEHYLTLLFSQQDPEAIGNDYLAIGTVEKSAWKEGLKQQQSIDKLLPYASDFKTYYGDLQLTRAGYYHADREPPIAVPPPSQDWVKINPTQAASKQ